MNKIGSIFKIILLSVIGLVGLTYLTIEQPKQIKKQQIDLKNLPVTVELIGFEDQKFSTKSIVKPNSILFVGNHESIVLANHLQNMLNLKDGQFVTISNVSDAPWFIKRWQAHTKNTNIKGEKHQAWIYDRDGAMRNFLQVPTSDSIKYFVYRVKSDGIIESIYTGKVKVGTIDGKMSKDEITENLKTVVELINK